MPLIDVIGMVITSVFFIGVIAVIVYLEVKDYKKRHKK